MAELGVQDVMVRVAGDWNRQTSGTLTITALDIEGFDSANHYLEATLELDDDPWSLSGPIAVYGCERLNVYAP